MMKQQILLVQGISCESCVTAIKKKMMALDGVKEITVNIITGHLFVLGDVDVKQLIDCLTRLGYKAKVLQKTSPITTNQLMVEDLWPFWAVGLLFGLTIPFWLHMFIPFKMAPILQLSLATMIQITYGARFYKYAYVALKQRTLTMDVLVMMSATIAYGIALYDQLYLNSLFSYEESVLLLFFIWLGRTLEVRIKGQTKATLQSILELQSPQAKVLRMIDGKWQEMIVPLMEILPDETVIVLPGELIPIDGIILKGEAMVDTAILTGESFPVQVKAGDEVKEATKNLDGYLEIKTILVGHKTAVGQLVQVVAQSLNHRPTVQQLVDRVVSKFIPLILFFAALALIINYLKNGDISNALYASAAVLVAACPCALGLSAPLAGIIGLRIALKEGILIRGSLVCETLAKVDTVVVDKTGTLTAAKPKVVDFYLTSNHDEENIKTWVSATERATAHPLATALINWADIEHHLKPTYTKTYPGSGVRATVEKHDILIGTSALLEQEKISIVPSDKLEAAFSLGKTVVYMAIDQQYAGHFVIDDPLHKDAQEAIKNWQQQNLDVILLSGDDHQTVKRIATQLGLKKALAKQSPADKAKEVRLLQKQGRKVAMIGDGINDSIALTSADIGVAIGGGTKAAREVADIILLKGTIGSFHKAMLLAKKIVKNTKQNLTIVFLFNGIGIILAMLGQLPPFLAAAAMAGSSLFVALNALRLIIDKKQ